MSTLLSVALALSAAGGLAWLVRWYEAGREPHSTECSRIVNAVFTKAGSDAKDAELLSELLLDRDHCLQDATFVDQARRLMTNLQRSGDARKLLEQADSYHAFKPDELKAQFAWIDEAESREAWSNGDEARAKELNAQATAAANTLREKWPEWSLPYRILGEASQSGVSGVPYGQGADYFQMEREVRARKMNGAWIRSFSDWQPMVFTFVVAALGFLALAAGLDGFIDAREISGRRTSQIASATPGYVELKGTLQYVTSGASVIGPLSKAEAVWYEQQYNSGGKKARTQYTRSAQPFVLRDATGDVVIDPDGISVQTRHSKTQFGNSVGMMTGARTTEKLLKDGDPGFVLGELYLKSGNDGTSSKHVRVAQDGRRLFVSNYSEAELISMEKMWFAAGCIICALSFLLLGWSYYQRYQVIVAPGLLL